MCKDGKCKGAIPHHSRNNGHTVESGGVRYDGAAYLAGYNTGKTEGEAKGYAEGEKAGLRKGAASAHKYTLWLVIACFVMGLAVAYYIDNIYAPHRMPAAKPVMMSGAP